MMVSRRRKLSELFAAIGFTPYAYEAAGDTQTWRASTKTSSPKCKKDRRRREWERRSREEHGRRLVPPRTNDSAVSQAAVQLTLRWPWQGGAAGGSGYLTWIYLDPQSLP